MTEVRVSSQGPTPIPAASFKLTPGTRTVRIDFEPGPLLPDAFERAELQLQPDRQSLVMTQGGLDARPWVFSRSP